MTVLTLTAPAKINLFLSVTGRRDNGYHELQSLVAFTKNFGDIITISPSDQFSFDSTATHLPTDENNLVICAATLLADALNKDLNLSIHLSKHIPIGAGLGGGSSDAAATIKGLLKFWCVDDMASDELNDILLKLGADVPSCYHAQSCYFEGIGDIITPLNRFPSCYTVLAYPNAHSSTQEIFKNFNEVFSNPIGWLPTYFNNIEDLIAFLSQQKNDLTPAATKNMPDIQETINIIDEQENCLLARMSGSGSACFGLFKTPQDAQKAQNSIREKHPQWWVKSVEV